jgi:hypothetical protein
VALAALTRLAPSIAADSTRAGRSDGLAANDASARLRVSPDTDAELLAERVFRCSQVPPNARDGSSDRPSAEQETHAGGTAKCR